MNRSNQTQPLFDELAQNPFVFVNRVGEIFASSSKEIEAIQKLISQVGLVFVDQIEKTWISNAGGAFTSWLIRMSWARVCNICKSSQSALTAKRHKKETCLKKMMILLWWRFLKKHWQKSVMVVVVVRAFVVEMVVMVVTMGENSRQAFAMHLVLGSTACKNLFENLPTPARQRVHQGELFPPSAV